MNTLLHSFHLAPTLISHSMSLFIIRSITYSFTVFFKPFVSNTLIFSFPLYSVPMTQYHWYCYNVLQHPNLVAMIKPLPLTRNPMLDNHGNITHRRLLATCTINGASPALFLSIFLLFLFFSFGFVHWASLSLHKKKTIIITLWSW